MKNISRKYKHCGPITHPGINVTVDENGIQAKDFVYENKKAAKPDPWSANWIWLNNEKFPELQESVYSVFCQMGEKNKHAVALFRKEIVLKDGVESVKAWVSADVKYRLYVNGIMVGRGPAEVSGDYGYSEPAPYWYYDQYDLGYIFKPGVNVITAEVVLQPDEMADYSMGHGGFLFEAKVDYSNGQSETIISDDTWQGTPGSAFINHFRNPFAGHGHANLYLAQLELAGWHEEGFDASGWPGCDVVDKATGGRWNLIPREVPPLMEARIQARKVLIPFEQHRHRIENPDAMLRDDDTYALVRSGSPVTFWLDFGKEYSGHLCFLIDGVRDMKLRIEYQEIAGKSDRFSEYIMRDGLQEFECIRLDAFEHVKVTISNFCGKDIKIYNMCCNFTSYPVSYEGKFQCSDDLLNKVWQVGAWTNQMCMQAYHLDSPIHQETVSCVGDYVIESLMNYYTFGDKWLVRQDLKKLANFLQRADGVMFCTSYSLLWTEMLADYYRYTGDDSLFDEMMPVVDMLLLKCFEGYKDETGLIADPPRFTFMDWVVLGAHNLHNPPKAMGQAYLNAFYFRALKNAAMFCKISGKAAEEERYIKLADETRAVFNRHFWNEEKGLYIDGLDDPCSFKDIAWGYPANVEGTYFSQHTNSLAVLYDLAPQDKHAEIMQRVIEDKTLAQAQPYFMHFVFEALNHAGVFHKYGFDQMRRWKSLLDEHSSSLKETWSGDFDFSHAWGGSPTYQLSSKVLGVRPIEPGFELIGIEPVFGDLSQAAGKVPTPKGIVEVSWTKRGSEVDLQLSIPEGCKAVLNIPAATIEKSEPNGKVSEQKTATMDVQSGRYRVRFA